MKKEEKILVADIGNSYIKIGYFLNGKISKFYYSFKSNKHVIFKGIDKLDYDILLISSVVSTLTDIVIKKLNKKGKVKVINIDKLKKNIKVDIKENKDAIGADLYADLIAAKKEYKCPCIIFDIGTVNKVLALNKKGVFIGCSFFPGLMTSTESLNIKTDALPHIEDLKFNKTCVGKDTIEAITSGVLYSNLYAIEGFIKDYKKILGKESNVIFTGGGFIHMNKMIHATYDVYLTLKGIYYIYKENY